MRNRGNHKKAMICGNKNIKELLPDYSGQRLEAPEVKRVEDHVRVCEDCRMELSVLKIMSEESVPDPGEAFWGTMPQRIHREIERREDKKTSLPARLLNSLLVPHWAWATAGVCILVVAVWFFVQPAVIETARTGEDIPVVEETTEVNLAELDSRELEAATQWAQNEIAPIREAVTQEIPENEGDISEALSELNARELDRIYEMLETRERDLQNQIRNKTKREKNVG